jgi:hypothetical protein
MTPEQLNQVHLSWCVDLFQRILLTAKDPLLTDEHKLIQIAWFAKQGLKVEREE